ncbi:MAG: DUF2341 domain-containing protein [Planctomyces sp.]|nr:DUF2341 domain-containing protein [Planctomyces sp.]
MKKLAVAILSVMLNISFLSASFGQYSEWKHSGEVTILTTSEGANLPETANVKNFPLLVILHRDFLDFRQTNRDGSDVRFSTSNGVPLRYQIDSWNHDEGIAAIWVRIPRVEGNRRQSIKVYWGNPKAASESAGAAVFAADNDYASVWHLGDAIQDEVGTLSSVDTGTDIANGVIGKARSFPGGKGIFCGEEIANYPSLGDPHSTEAWFRATVPNTTLIGWGNEGGGRGSKVRMQLRSPPHIHIDSDFSDVDAPQRLTLGEWTHVVHTYAEGFGHIYINGQLAGESNPTLDIKSPARMWIGGWYHNYDFVGELDEVRISRVARSPEWIRLQYENTKRFQTLTGPLIRHKSDDKPSEAVNAHTDREVRVTPSTVVVTEGDSVTLTAELNDALKIYWFRENDGQFDTVEVDRLTYAFDAGRVTGNTTRKLRCRAVFADGIKDLDIHVEIREATPDPDFTLSSPARWDGREPIDVIPQLTNADALNSSQSNRLNFQWKVEGPATTRTIESDRLLLTRAHKSGMLTVTATIDNGGAPVERSVQIEVQEPRPSQDTLWMLRQPAETETPEDHQFVGRDVLRGKETFGRIYYRGRLDQPADSLFARVYADDQLAKTLETVPDENGRYSIEIPLSPGLIHYRTELVVQHGAKETVLHTASDIVCGDVFLINGQSNAVATDFGEDSKAPESSEWVRTFGATDGGPKGSRLRLWGPAVARSPGGKLEIGYWGMELGKRLVAENGIPVCFINGAVGGSRIDQHQKNSNNPTDPGTIYGRLLWRVREARLQHGVRAIIWHQGENDQGADGPTGQYGYETYRENFINLAAAWKGDFPNVSNFYVFQIWPRACAMGSQGSDNRLREVQRTLPRYFSNLSVIATLGIKPPGGCHFPAEGYREFAKLLLPHIQYQIYHRFLSHPITHPDLVRAQFSSENRDEILLEFDSPVNWRDESRSQFFLDGMPEQVVSGSQNERFLTLRLKAPTPASRISYVDSESWNQDHILFGVSDRAVLSFCDVSIDEPIVKPQPLPADGSAGIKVVVDRPEYPVLIRNENGVILRVEIERTKVPLDSDVHLQSLMFSMEGTDNPQSIKSLRVFSTEADETFVTSNLIGEATLENGRTSVQLNRALKPGRNNFWLTCELNPNADLHNRIRASCTEVVTSIGSLVPGDDSRVLAQRTGVALRKHNDDGVHTYRIPALTTSRDGTLLAVYDMRRRMGRDLQEDIDIGLSRSTDGGQTWEPPRIIMDMGEFGGLPQEQNGCSDPGIIVDHQTGEIFCFALWMNGKPGKHQWVEDGSEAGFEIGTTAQFMMVRSTDDGRTWSPPENLTRQLKQESWWLLAPSPQAGISLADGTLVMPVQGRTGRETLETFATIMVSRDHGKTWTVSAPGYTGGNECQAVQLSDQSIMLNIRNDRERYRAVVVTHDLGQTWTEHSTHRKTLIEPNCNGSLLNVRLRDSQNLAPHRTVRSLLLFANPNTQKGRTHHAIQVSFDEGQTWPDSHKVLLDEGLGAGYPSMTQIDDEHIGIVYEGSQSHLVFERFHLRELIEPAWRIGDRELLKIHSSTECTGYLRRLLAGTPFGTHEFDLNGLRAGMGARSEPQVPGANVAPVIVGNIPCHWVTTPGSDNDLRLLYLHGGGWVSGAGENYLPLAADISRAAKCVVLLPDYRLAPEYPYPAGLDDCVTAYEWLLENGPDGPRKSRSVFIAGDSAGGNLTLATLLALKQRGVQMPNGGIAISPATDFTLTSESLRSVHDPIISARTMPEFRSRYLGQHDPTDPLASPVFGDYRNLPPILIQIGANEMLLDDGIRAARKARADGVSVQLEVWPNSVHVFQIRGLPESHAAIARIAKFMNPR